MRISSALRETKYDIWKLPHLNRSRYVSNHLVTSTIHPNKIIYHLHMFGGLCTVLCFLAETHVVFLLLVHICDHPHRMIAALNRSALVGWNHMFWFIATQCCCRLLFSFIKTKKTIEAHTIPWSAVSVLSPALVIVSPKTQLLVCSSSAIS